MGKKLAIKGHPTRGKEVIELLEMIGGINDERYIGTNSWKDEYYFLDNGYIRQYDWCDGIKFTLEEFLWKYPFKVGDKVFDKVDGDPGIIAAMKWDEDVSDMKYHVAFDNGDMGWYTNDTIGVLKEDENLEEGKTMNKKLAIRGHLTRGKEVIELLEMIGGKNTYGYDGDMKEKDKAKAPDIKGEDYSGKRFGYKIPDGYEFDVVVDGKIFIKPIKSRYPKTYTECCEILGIGSYFEPEIRNATAEECRKFAELIRLKRCRDAYWKIAGKEMGFGKSWEPKYEALVDNTFFTIQTFYGEIDKSATSHKNSILAFPTIEMRDTFYDNFKDLIEQCKELL